MSNGKYFESSSNVCLPHYTHSLTHTHTYRSGSTFYWFSVFGVFIWYYLCAYERAPVCVIFSRYDFIFPFRFCVFSHFRIDFILFQFVYDVCMYILVMMLVMLVVLHSEAHLFSCHKYSVCTFVHSTRRCGWFFVCNVSISAASSIEMHLFWYTENIARIVNVVSDCLMLLLKMWFFGTQIIRYYFFAFFWWWLLSIFSRERQRGEREQFSGGPHEKNRISANLLRAEFDSVRISMATKYANTHKHTSHHVSLFVGL